VECGQLAQVSAVDGVCSAGAAGVLVGVDEELEGG
jgi:hypothetical protein